MEQAQMVMGREQVGEQDHADRTARLARLSNDQPVFFKTAEALASAVLREMAAIEPIVK